MGKPLALGEGSTKNRIKNIFLYKKICGLPTCELFLLLLCWWIVSLQEETGDKQENKQTAFLADVNRRGGVHLRFKWPYFRLR